MKTFVRRIIRSKPALLVLVAIIGISAGLTGTRLAYAMGNDRPQEADSCQGVCVELRNGGMVPNELAIEAGQSVQFNSADGKKHNIAEGQGAGNHGHETSGHEHDGASLSGDFGTDEAWRVKFDKPGTYRFHDHYSPEQNILIVVYEKRET
jgi:plastocyanin